MIHRAFSFVLPLTLMAVGAPSLGCGRSAPPPPVDDSQGRGSVPTAPAEKTGMTTTQKGVLLAGAAALYYLYKHHQKAAAAAGEEGQYYLSKNGRVYYRDAEHRAHWVTPPPEGIRVPESEANEYSSFQGYQGAAAGRDLAGMADD